MKRFKNILLVVDPELKAEAVLERAVALAENNQARLTVISVIEAIPIDSGIDRYGVQPDKLQSAMIEARLQQLESLIEPARARVGVHAKVLTGTPFLEIVREVLRADRDLVIKIAKGNGGFMARLFGSTDMHLLRKCSCPVWLMNHEQTGWYKRILAAVDFDEFGTKEHKDALNRQILEMAMSLALSEFSELHIGHAWEAMAESIMRRSTAAISVADTDAYVEEVRQQHRNQLYGLLNELAAWMGKDALDCASPQLHLRRGSGQDVIPLLVNELQADLVVMGTVARTGIGGLFMGNTAETILNRINCSVLTVKPKNFVTPVTLDN